MDIDKFLTKAWVFPCSNSYAPLIKWSKESKKGIASFPGHNGKWGINVHLSGLFCVDVDIDPVKNKRGDITLLNLPELPETFTTRSRNGKGRHIWFKGTGPTTAGTLGNGLDTRGEGGIVFLGEETINYAEVAPMPDWLTAKLAHVQEAREANKKGKKGVELVELDQPDNIRDAKEYLASAPVAVEGMNGDSTTLLVCMRLKDLGISPETALELLLAHWNDDCEPPWDAVSLDKKVTNAFEYGQNAIGSATEEGQSKLQRSLNDQLFGEDVAAYEGATPVAAAASDDSDDLWTEPTASPDEEEEENTPTCVASWNDADVLEREWIIDEWLPAKAVSAMYGPPGVGKSLISLETAVCLSTGTNWFGQKVTKACPTLYVSCEDDEQEARRRIRDIRKKSIHAESSSKEEQFFFWDRVGRTSLLTIISHAGKRRQKFLSKLEDFIAGMGPPEQSKVVILDTLTDFSDMNENDRNHVNQFIKNTLGALAWQHNCTVLFIAHPSKSAAYSGSTAMQGGVRAQLFIAFVEGQNSMRLLSKGKTNYSERHGEGDGILVEWQKGAFHYKDQGEFESELKAMQKRAVFNLVKAQSMEQPYIKLSPSASNPLKAHVIRDEAGGEVPHDVAKSLITEMLHEGTIDDTAGGLLARNFVEDTNW